jgi:hypothetical protein
MPSARPQFLHPAGRRRASKSGVCSANGPNSRRLLPSPWHREPAMQQTAHGQHHPPLHFPLSTKVLSEPSPSSSLSKSPACNSQSHTRSVWQCPLRPHTSASPLFIPTVTIHTHLAPDPMLFRDNDAYPHPVRTHDPIQAGRFSRHDSKGYPSPRPTDQPRLRMALRPHTSLFALAFGSAGAPRVFPASAIDFQPTSSLLVQLERSEVRNARPRLDGPTAHGVMCRRRACIIMHLLLYCTVLVTVQYCTCHRRLLL